MHKIQLKPLRNQVVVVFGASSGIGRETARRFSQAGAKVVVSARDLEGLDSLVAELKQTSGEALSLPADTSDFAQVQAVADLAVERFGRIDTWVQVAATAIYATFEETTPEEFRRVIEVNLIGEAYGAKAALPHLRRAGGGALILIGSVESVVPMPYHTAYNASKHGIKGLADTLRLELAHDKAPISLTTIMPAGVDTPFFNNARTRLGVKPRPPRPIYHPSHVADAVLHAAAHPTRELYVGGAALMFVMGYRFVPKLVDLYMLAKGFAAQRTPEPKSDAAPSALNHPQTRDARTEGDFASETRRFSLYTWLQTHPAIWRTIKLCAWAAALTAVAESLPGGRERDA